MDECIDKDEYPESAEIKSRWVHMLIGFMDLARRR